MNRDPLGEAGGLNLYGFVGNSPVNHIDSHGLFAGKFIGHFGSRITTRQIRKIVRDTAKDFVKDQIYNQLGGELAATLGPEFEDRFKRSMNKFRKNRKGRITDWLDPSGIVCTKRDLKDLEKKYDVLLKELAEIQDDVIAAKLKARASRKPDLTDARGRTHILDGDGPGRGGGHRHGTVSQERASFRQTGAMAKSLGKCQTSQPIPTSDDLAQIAVGI